jgi:hypothetical protein
MFKYWMYRLTRPFVRWLNRYYEWEYVRKQLESNDRHWQDIIHNPERLAYYLKSREKRLEFFRATEEWRLLGRKTKDVDKKTKGILDFIPPADEELNKPFSDLQRQIYESIVGLYRTPPKRPPR